MTAELVPVETQSLVPANLFGIDNPKAIIASATAKADALADVVKKKGLASNISGREYVRVEGWTLLGSLMGVFPVCVWSREVENGWEARVEARTMDGHVVGAAEAQCCRDENTWKGRSEFALRSMAQTRATSKALRLPLGFVMALAGFEATPAEEMDDIDRTPPPVRQAPQRAPQRPQQAPTPRSAAVDAVIEGESRVLPTVDSPANILAEIGVKHGNSTAVKAKGIIGHLYGTTVFTNLTAEQQDDFARKLTVWRDEPEHEHIEQYTAGDQPVLVCERCGVSLEAQSALV
jgi:hypothetical protein